MPNKPKRPRPVKPLEWRPWPGSAIRITVTAGAVIPRLLTDVLHNVKKGE